MMMSDNHGLLRALHMNAVFSAISAAMLLLAGRWVAVQLGLAGPLPVYITSGLLLLFAMQLWNIVRKRAIRSMEIAGIIFGDLAWVAASVVLLALYHSSMTTAGVLLVDMVALAVLYFAVQQFRGLRAFRGDARG